MRLAVGIIFTFLIIAIGVGIVATFLSHTGRGGVQPAKENTGSTTTGKLTTFQVSRDGGKTFIPEELPSGILGKNFAITYLLQDPDVPDTWWLGTNTAGLLRSPDNGRTWQTVPGYPQGGLGVFARIPNSNALYLANFREKRGRILLSEDGGNSFSEVYSTAAENISLSTLAVDHIDANMVYATQSDGLLIRSTDRGKTWEPGRRFSGYITRLIIPKTSPKDMYVVIPKNGVYHSANRAEVWDDYQKSAAVSGAKLSSFSGGTDIFELAPSPSHAGEFLLATAAGILGSLDHGASYVRITSLIPPSALPVLSIAYDPNRQGVFLATAANGLYRTEDWGNSWSIVRLETPLRIVGMLLDRRDGQTIFFALGK